MKKLPIFLLLIVIIGLTFSCKTEKAKPLIEANNVDADSLTAGDTTVYGVMIDGGMNSIVLLTDVGDTLIYIQHPDDSIDVVKGGKLEGDRFAIIGYKEYGDLILRNAINLTSLLGNWTSIDKDFEIKEGGKIVSNNHAERNAWTSWKIYNGKLVLSKDTFEILTLNDSMALENQNGIFMFNRKTKR